MSLSDQHEIHLRGTTVSRRNMKTNCWIIIPGYYYLVNTSLTFCELGSRSTSICSTMTMANGSVFDHEAPNQDRDFYTLVEDVMYLVLTPALCIIGCLGNIINLVVLMKGSVRMRKADGNQNSGTTLGLALLAVSDLLFCVANCPRAVSNLSGSAALFQRKDFRLYYQVYGTGVVTTFLMISTWLTVAMAMLRYMGICHSLSMRRLDNTSLSRIVYVSTVIFSVLLNLPSFGQFKITEFDGLYLIDLGPFSQSFGKGIVFLWVRTIFGVFIPAVLLCFCNISLVIALHRSAKMRRECYVQKSTNRHSNRITRMLIILVVLFVCLVFPSELMDFFQEVIKTDSSKTSLFIVARSIANVLQVMNFACNFLLYFVLSVHFRNTAKELFTCQRSPYGFSNSKSFGQISRYNVTTQTAVWCYIKAHSWPYYQNDNVHKDVWLSVIMYKMFLF